ncbi:MAG: O-antigen ligase family protein [Thermoflexales bacterium]|nr:O-antigen ligase family protein [Thermoflexales bacterium]
MWCDRVIEAGWLAALIVVPLFFNIYSSRVFEPDKLTTLRSIALVMAAAWLVKWIEERRNPARERVVSWRTPLVLPTLVLVVVYLLSTALSVAPRTSLLGSYQRLQGTYTTFAYIIVFLMIVQGMRTRAQLERALTLIVLNSLPISVYGLFQRLQIDPLPWGGDTVERVAGNMGNSIFIAAYLVMTFFINLYRITESAFAVFRDKQPRWTDVVRIGLYSLIALFNAIVVLILAGSRGPQLGWLGGVLFFVMLLVQLIRQRRLRLVLTGATILAALGGLSFLIFLNITRPDPNYAWLRQFPLFARLSTVLTTEEGTNAVRVLIWDGAARLVAPHDPIQMPDGKPDPFNAIRPLVGYGPESMYVAYNRFYPPKLAWFEARNASPDRSHNETWDALVITGVVGFVAYMFLFMSVLYYGARWVGLIASRFEGWLFIALWIAGGAAVGGYLIATGNTPLFGVGLAGGITLLGLMPFLFISALINALRAEDTEPATSLPLRDQLLIIAIIATVVAHFVEIHTGIAIAATRTYFWALIGIMVVVGTGLIREETVKAAEPEPVAASEPKAVVVLAGGTRRQRRAAQQAAARAARAAPLVSSSLPVWFGTVAAYGLFIGLIMAVLAFDFVNNAVRATSAGQVFASALTFLPQKSQNSLGILSMMLGTLAVGTALVLAELRRADVLHTTEQTLAAGGLILSLGLLLWVLMGTFIGGRLAEFASATQNTIGTILSIADQLGAFPAYLYLAILGVMVAAAFALRNESPVAITQSSSLTGLTTLAAVAVFVPVNAAFSNLQPIAADIVYKQASPWDQQGSREVAPGSGIQGWDLAIEHYRRAIDLARNEDFYYLWLGRALLEKAKSTPVQTAERRLPDDVAFTTLIDANSTVWRRPTPDALPSASLSREDLLAAARIILEAARIINPLNTDHSANLARMWRQAADITADPELRMTRLRNSDLEYATATSLSPNNAGIWNEWGTLHLYSFRDLDKAKEKFDRSLELDPRFDQTYALLASWHVEKANTLLDKPEERTKHLKEAKTLLQRAAELAPNSINVYQEIARLSIETGDLYAAITATQNIVRLNPTDWNALKNLAVLYRDVGDLERAKEFAERALPLMPPEQQPAMQAFVQQLAAPR